MRLCLDGVRRRVGDGGRPESELDGAQFALLALCEALDVDAEAALETARSKYDDRLAETGEARSGQ